MEDLVRDFFERSLSESEKDRLGEVLVASPEAADRFAQLAEEAYRATGYPEPVPPGAVSGGNIWIKIGLTAALAFLLILGWWCGKGSGSIPLVASQYLKTAAAPSGETKILPSASAPSGEKTGLSPVSAASGETKAISPASEPHQAISISKVSGVPQSPVGSIPMGAVDASPRKDALPAVSSPDSMVAAPAVSERVTSTGDSPGAQTDAASSTVPALDPSMKSIVVPESVTLAGRKPIPQLRVTIQADARVVVEVFAPDGTKVKTLASSRLLAGTHLFPWDERDEAGARVMPGAYRMVVTAGDEKTERIVQVGAE